METPGGKFDAAVLDAPSSSSSSSVHHAAPRAWPRRDCWEFNRGRQAVPLSPAAEYVRQNAAAMVPLADGASLYLLKLADAECTLLVVAAAGDEWMLLMEDSAHILLVFSIVRATVDCKASAVAQLVTFPRVLSLCWFSSGDALERRWNHALYDAAAFWKCGAGH